MIPSLLQIPSAVSDSKLHSVLPNNGKGDFQFDRSTGATRINRDGLIEEVGYFSSELVQNGNFSELGSELIVNGDFATDSDWTLATGWTINNSKLVGNSIFGNAVQDINFTNGKTYKVTFTISDYVKGKVRFQFTGGSTVNGTARDANGVYTQYIVATANHTDFKLRGVSDSGGFTGKVDNVSVKQVDPNDRWTVTNADSNNFVEFTQGQARLKFLNTSPITQLAATAPYKGGKTYKLIVDVASVTSGSIKVDASGISETFNTAGVTTRIVSPTGNGNIHFYRASANVDITLNSVSLVEVQGDRPRLSYDITNGVVEDKPHLLLEPSATNLIKFSEDFTQAEWTKNNTSINSNNIIAPDGTLTADKLIENTSNAQHTIYDNVAWTTGQDYSFSVFAKKGERNILAIVFPYTAFGAWKYASFNLDTGATITVDSGVTASIESLPNGWYRCIATATTNATTSADMAIKMQTVGSSQGESYQGDGSSGFYIWGAMLEQQSYATSYIPTAGTIISRASETCNNSKPSVNSTEGVLYAEIQALASDSTDKVITMSDGSTSNRVQVYFNSSNQIVGGLISGGSGQAAITYSTDIKLVSKIAFKYKQNDFALWVNGSEVGTDVVGNPATGLNVIDFDNGAGGANFYGKLKGLAVYNEALSESQLMQLTGVTASSIYNNFVTRTVSFTVEALNEVKKVIDNL
jgi:hypothetical protein